MSKPKEIPIEDKNYFAWPYEEQTQIKHKVLGAYYKVYASKLGAKGNTLFVDCHGGCGAYIIDDSTISYGSSILVDAVSRPIFNSRDTHNSIVVCEQEKTNFDNLAKIIKLAGVENIKLFNEDYNVVLKGKSIISAYTANATLFFVDPFGYYNTPMANMSNLIRSFGNELLINFMFDFLNRGIGVSSIDEGQLTSFFGCDKWKEAKTKTGLDRESFLIDLYKNNLKQTTGAKYVFAYRLCYPDRYQTYYYLIHATNHIAGITLMKDCFASINNGRVEYLGKRNDEISLFDMDYYKQDELENLLKSKYSHKTISFESIWCDIVEDTATLEKELRSTLKEMEAKNIVTINRIESKRTGLKGKDEITIR